MSLVRISLLALAFAAVACSASTSRDAGPATAADDATMPPPPDGGNATPPDAAPGDEPFGLAPPVRGFQLHIGPFEQQPGDERERCQFLDLGNTSEIYVARLEMAARPGLHHSNVMAFSGPHDNTTVPCFGIPDELMSDPTRLPKPVFASSVQATRETFEFPAGVALRFPARQKIMFNYHTINATDRARTEEVYVNLTTVSATAAAELADTWLFANQDIVIPPMSTAEVSADCKFPRQVNLLSLTPHMHAHGTRLRVLYSGGPRDGELVYETTTWDSPAPLRFQPPLVVPLAQGLRYGCSYRNTSAATVRRGPTFDDEMCIVFGYFYPVAFGPIVGGVDSSLGVLSCLVTGG